MQGPLAWKSAAVVLAIVFIFAGAGPRAELSIIDDEPDPVGNVVEVVVANAAAGTERGVVEFRVVLQGGKGDAVTQRVVVPGNGSAAVSVTFAKPVQSVIYVGVIEGPDPIPQ